MKRQFNGFRLLVGSFLLGMLLPGATALADPIVNIESPLGTEPLVLNKSTRVEVTVTNADVPILSVDIYRDGILLGEADPAGGNSWSLDFSPASLSPFELYAEAMDDDGVTWVSDTLEYTVVQPEAPQVSILAPFEGSIHPAGTEVPVQLTAHDPYGIIRQVDLLLNGETFIQYTWDPASDAWVYSPPNPEATVTEDIPYRTNVLLPSPGDYDLQARVVSTTGLDEYSETVTVTAKDLSTSPALSILSPVSGSRYLPGTILPVQVEAYDPDGLIEQVEFLLNDVVVATAAAAPFRADVELPSTGTYVLTARCTTSNAAVAYSQEVILEAGPPDAVSPRVVIDFPLPLGGGDTVNDVSYASAMFFNATATDPDGGTIEDVRFYINGQFLGSAENHLGDVFSRFYQPNAQGNYVISAEAVDNDGNVGWSVPLLLDVGPLERQLPQAAVKEPASAVQAGRSMDFFVEADGGLIPIDRVDLFVDGIYVGSSEEALADGTFAISWTPVATGTYDLQARVVQIDPAGATYDNWKITEPLTITVAEPSTFPDPVVEILTPFDGTVQPTSKTLPIRLNAYDPNGLISQVELSLNGQTIIRYVIDNANGTWNAQALWPFVSPGENIPLESVLALPSTGDYLLQARAVSTTGEDGLSETVLLTGADTVTTPVLNILSPVSGSRYLPGTILPVQVEAFDPGGLIQEVEFLLNGEVVGTVTGAPYRTEVQLPSTGTYVLTARAATTTGARAVSQEVILEAGAPDTSSPRVVIDFPLPLGAGDTVNDVSYASAMFFNATATDPDGGTIEDVRFYINGQFLGSAENQLGDVYSRFYQPNAQGNYVISAEAVDNDGNVGWSVPLLLDVGPLERQLPQAAVKEPASAVEAGRSIDFFVEADGGLIPIDRVDLFADGIYVGSSEEALADGTFAISWTPVATGTYDLQARVVQIDPAGATYDNWKITNPLTITVTEPTVYPDPTLSILAPVSGSRYLPGTILPVQVEAFDPGGLIQEVEFLLNGAVVGTVTGAPYRAEVQLPSTGTYVLTARAATTTGAQAVSQEVILEAGAPDAVSPRVVIDFPLPLGGGDTVNDVSYASAMFFNATATDPDGGTIEDVRFYINGQFLGGAENQLGDVYSRFYQPNAQGNYVISAEAVDNDGNVGWSVPLLLDVGPLERQLPQAAVREPASAVQAGRAMDFFVEADGGLIPIDRVDLFVDGIYVGSSEEALADGTFAISWTPVATGTYDLQARVVQIDPAGATYDNWKITDALTITVTEPATLPDPEVEIFAPFDGSIYPTGTLVPVQLTAYDPNGLIEGIELFLNGEPIISYVWDQNNLEWAVVGPHPNATPTSDLPFRTDVQLVSPGDYLVQARVVSSTGLDGISETLTLTAKDLSANPVLNILSPESGSRFLPGTILPVQVEAFDPGGLIEQVEFLLNDMVVASVASAPFRAEVELPSSGTYVLTARATTNTGAQAFSQEVFLEAGPPDEVSPRIVIDFPLPLGAGDTVNDVSYASAMFFNATATDPDGGTIEDVRFYINGQFLGSAENQLGDVYSRFYQPNAQGNYVISAEAVDNDGNVGWSVPLLLDVGPLERQLPEAEITRPFTGSSIGRIVKITVEADGGLVPIDRVDFFADGVLLGSVEESAQGGEGSEGPSDYSFSWVAREPGTYDLQARIVQIDPAGATYDNWTITDPVTVTITANESPTGIIELPLGDEPTVRSFVPIDVVAVDSDGFVQSIDLFVNGEPLEGTTWQPFAVGTYELSALLVDNSRNEVVISREVIVKDQVGTRPRVTLSVSASGNVTPDSRVVVLANVYDDTPDDISVTFYSNGNVIGTDNEAPYSVIVDPEIDNTDPFGRRAYSLQAIATDPDGNNSLNELSPLYISDVFVDQPTIRISNISDGDVFTLGSRVPIRVELVGGAAPDLSSLILYGDGVEIDRINQVNQSGVYFFDWIPDSTGPVEIAVSTMLNNRKFDHDGDGGGQSSTPSIDVTPVNVTFPVNMTINEAVGRLPSISLEALPQESGLAIGSKVLVFADAQDLDGEVSQVEFFLDGALIGTDTAAPFTHILTTEGQGNFSLNALATDSSGNVVTSTFVNLQVTPRVITQTPGIILTVPESGQEGSLLSLRASTDGFVNPPENIFFYANGQKIGEDEDAEAPYSYDWLANLNGPVTFFATASQVIDEQTTLTTVSNVVESDLAENLPPEITDVVVDFPNKSDVKPDPLAGELLTFRVSVSDSGPLREVELLRDGEVLKSSESPASPFEITDTPPGLGFYEYSIVVTDRGGLQAQSEVIPVSVVVGQGPVVEIIAPTDGDIVSPDATVRLEATVADPDGFITEVSFFVNGIQVGDTLTESPYAAEFSPGVAGSYTVMARARDNSGNLTEADPVTFTVPADELPQIVTFSNNLPGSVARLGQEITWSVDATDDFGLASIELLRNGTAVETEAVLPLEIVDTIRTLGRFRYVARVTDTSGQVTESEVIEITSTRGSPPVVQIVEPTSGVRIVPDGDGVVVRATANPADEPAGVPGGSIARVEFFLNGSSIGAKTTAPYLVEVDSELTVAGSNVVIAVATTDTGLTASSQEITIEQVDGSIPTILRFESDSTDGSELVGTEINFTVQATDEKGIEVVELLLFGQVVDTVTSQPYVLSYIPESPGTYSFTVRVVNTDGNDAVSEEAITISVRLPDPLGNTADFVSQTYVDLLFRLPTFAEKAEATRLLNNGSLTKDRFIRELINPADGLAESDYDAVRGALLANRFLLGIWPSRDKLEDDTGAVRDGGLSALVTSLMIDFEDSYMADTGASGLPSTLSSDAEIGDYVSYMFGLKYGVLPDAAQLSLGKLHFRAGGRDAFTASFISDAEVVATPNGWTSTGLGFNFGVGSPPDDTYLRQADAASLLINFLRVVPSDAEVEELAAKLFATQVAEVVDDPRYAARFTSTFRQLENHVDGWKYSDWFGWFNTATDPWVYHSEQGWVAFRTIGQDDQNFWYYDVEMGWIWTQADMYPVVYESRGGHWLMGLRQPYSPEAGRWFFDFNQNDWTKR